MKIIKNKDMNVIKEIEVKNYPENNTPVIRVFDDSTSYLLIDEMDDIFEEDDLDNLEEILSSLLDVEVEQEDRERFIIMTNDLEKIEKLNHYLENYNRA